jgi:BspA type Leucine rich repeat region (6 copies)
MKQLFTFLFVVWWLPLTLQAQFTYTTNSGAITITGYTGLGGTVTIPNTINGYPVSSVGDNAFQYNNVLTNLIVGTNVLSLGRNTFAYNTNLATVIIPNSVTNIVGGTFYDCTNLVSITLGDGIRSVGDSSFAFDASLVGLYFEGNAPSFVSLTSIFYGVSAATVIYYNSGATGWTASYDALSTKTIQSQYGYSINSGGASVTLTNYYGPGGAVAIPAAIIGLPVTIIGYEAFNYTGFGGNLTSVIIPDSVTSISSDAFVNYGSLVNLTIPNSVTSLGNGAFFICGLTNVNIPSNVVNIGIIPFAVCSSLSAITVDPQNPVYSSAGGVLFNKNQTVLIEHPAGLAGAYAVPDSVTNISQAAFYYNDSLPSVTIFSKVTVIGTEVFLDCNHLTAIFVDSLNPAYASVNGVLFNKNQTTLIAYPADLAGPYKVPSSVTVIADYAFGGCVSLTAITLPTSLTSIGYESFYYCQSLVSVSIPRNVTYLADEAFIYCNGLTSLLFQGNTPTLGGQDVFYDVPSSTKVYYLADTIGWSTTYGSLSTIELFVPTLHNVSMAGGFSFAVTGVTNETIVVEGSTNLMDWQPVQTNSTPPFQFNDTHWTSYPDRFYRVSYAP